MNTMKKYINKVVILGLTTVLCLTSSCADFLSRPPQSSFTDDNFWVSEDNVEAFSYGLYNEFYGYGRGSGTYGEFYWQVQGSNTNMLYTDDLLNNTFLTLPNSVSASNSKWKEYYEDIRKANLMLARIPNVPMTDVAKKNWEGVAKFFRANMYFALVTAFGDVPYVDKYMGPDEKDLYVNRTDRKIIIDNIIADLQFAAANITLKKDDAINNDCANALLARIALFEGSYRKYHKLGESDIYFKTAETAANAIITSPRGYALSSDYKAKFNSINLKGNPEMIFYKRYEKEILTHSVQNYTHTSTVINGLTKAAVESYACTDGLPIGQIGSSYKGDKGIDNILANRDKRLLAAIYPELGYRGHLIQKAHPTIKGQLQSTTGYVVSMFDNKENGTDVTTGGQNHIDAPIYTLSEAYLIYAEAKAELKTLAQDDLDKTINLLRDRAGIARLTLAGENVSANGIAINDPKRTATLETQTMGGVVSPILWEIRRERRAELMTWIMLRYQDILRWGKGEYLDFAKNPDVALGAWIGNTSKDITVNTDGYILFYPKNSNNFESPKHYLNSIPNNEKLLFSAEGIDLGQNKDW
ncbi:MAG: RagB/SusD family nutrient uptake outer membrane protein [Anaerovoracaceae bacterium]